MTFPLTIALIGLILTVAGGVIGAEKSREFELKHLLEPAFIVLTLGLIVGLIGVAAEAVSA